MTIPITGGVELPALREDIELHTADGLTLVGELALPETVDPVATLVFLHPLPTHGGFMDSHIIRKAAARLPALADLAVLRFNFRGVTSPRGTSRGIVRRRRRRAARPGGRDGVRRERGLPNPWLLGWSFGTEVRSSTGCEHPIEGAILLSPPLHRTTPDELAAGRAAASRSSRSSPSSTTTCARRRRPSGSRRCRRPRSSPVEGGKHLWVGEKQTSRVLSEIVRRVNPAALPLPTEWQG